ncbi:hypothetical protein DXG01_012006, partial [Tephrocybe rancida]
TEAAAKFTEASRQDLVEKELQETEILEKFLPALLSETDIDAALREATAKFTEASRQGLVEKELQETEILEKFIPGLLSETDIDAALWEVVGLQLTQSKNNLGQLFNPFYQKIDRSTVDSYLVKRRTEQDALPVPHPPDHRYKYLNDEYSVPQEFSWSFPNGTQGFLYWHRDARLPPTTGQARFRVTADRNPASFEQGTDLL